MQNEHEKILTLLFKPLNCKIKKKSNNNFDFV